MRSVAMDMKTCYKHSTSVENHVSESFESHKAKGTDKESHHSKALGSLTKPTPSKWDDAQKWLAGFSSGGNDCQFKSKPRNSNAEDRRLLHSASQRGRDSCSSADVGLEEDLALRNSIQDEVETKKIDCSDLIWRINKPMENSQLEVKAVSLRDFGTEMTPIASQDPSRAATPIRATTPVMASPISSRDSTPGRCRQGINSFESFQAGVKNLERKKETLLFGTTSGNGWAVNREAAEVGRRVLGDNDLKHISNSLESRAMAWDEAERAKCMARFKREEVKIQAWENHEKRKAEMEMNKIEMKAERLKSRAQEKLANKLAANRRTVEEKRSNAESKLNESAARTSEKADYIRRTGHMPSSFLFKLPSFCG